MLAVHWGRILVTVCVMAATAGCTGSEEYEYEEEITLRLDGSALVTVNASVAALRALRGIELDAGPEGDVDPTRLEKIYGTSVTRVTDVERPWRRGGRLFVGITVEADDIRRLSEVPPFAWSAYEFEREEPEYRFRQRTSGPGGAVEPNAWSGEERVAFRYHVPSRIRSHNATSGAVERGNILVWTQPVRERLEGIPLAIEIMMETTSILSRTLWIFGLAFLAALLALALSVWWIRRGSAAPS